MPSAIKSPFASRVLNIEPSSTIAATAKAGELQRQGVDVVSLTAGEPDFDTPRHIQEAAIRAIQSGKTKYTVPVSGILELKQAICAKFQSDNELSYDTEQIIVTCGAKQTIFDAIVCLVEEGDEAIIPAPYWVSYADQVKLMGGTPVVVKTSAESGFKLTASQLRDAVSPRTKFLIFNSPCNPTGAVYSEGELRDLAEVIADSGIYVISDEIYEKILYDGTDHVSIAALNSTVKEKALIVNGVSKAYAMTGWRVGYGAGPADLIAHMSKVQSQETTNTCSISQYAALEALTGPQDSVEKMRQEFQNRRDTVVSRLNSIPGVYCLLPQGAFYVFPDISSLCGPDQQVRNDLEFSTYLLEEAHVAGVAGTGFGAEGHIRFSFAASANLIDSGLNRIEEAILKLS